MPGEPRSTICINNANVISEPVFLSCKEFTLHLLWGAGADGSLKPDCPSLAPRMGNRIRESSSQGQCQNGLDILFPMISIYWLSQPLVSETSPATGSLLTHCPLHLFYPFTPSFKNISSVPCLVSKMLSSLGMRCGQVWEHLQVPKFSLECKMMSQ